LNRTSRPLKICFLGWGDHVHLERWAGYFAGCGHEVSVISVSGRGRYPPGVKQWVLGLRDRDLVWKRLRIAYLLWRAKPDIVHVHWAHFGSMIGSSWRGPVVITAWGSDIYRTDELGAEYAIRLGESLRKASAITCDSQDQADRIGQIAGSKDGVSVIQWGIDTELFCPGESDPEFQRSVVEPGRPVVLSIRSFTPLYNLETIVEAFAQVLAKVPLAVLVMKKYNSQPEYVKAVEARIAELGVAHAVRIVEEIPYERMPDLYRMADVTVSVPSSDGTPMSLLEAMACGSVPIFTDLPSLREWIDDGQNGYLVVPKDPAALAGRILDVLLDGKRASRFAQHNQEIIRTKASQAVHMRRMEAIYQNLATRYGHAVASEESLT